jgi:uncharacterized membrane protein (UPF0182 family)
MFGGAVGTSRGMGAAAMAEAAASAAPTAGGVDEATKSAIAEAQRRYQAALDAQRQGDWARYGEEIRQLGAVLERLSAKRPR